MKELKKQTPDYLAATYLKDNTMVSEQIGFKKKDKVWLKGAHSLVGGVELRGEYYFDSFDSSNGTCFISNTETMSITYNVRIEDIEKVYDWRDTLNKVK